MMMERARKSDHQGPGRRETVDGEHDLQVPGHDEDAEAPRQMGTRACATGDHIVVQAQRGIGGGGGALPFLERIQQAFGPVHDLSSVRAHIGGDASLACAAISAQGYATGNDVAFTTSPSLHVAAHEAAHVVQQRAGVRLSDGVGQLGDEHEDMADRVADRVVRGESAADLLPATSTGGHASVLAVQRKPPPGQVKPLSALITQAKTQEAIAKKLQFQRIKLQRELKDCEPTRGGVKKSDDLKKRISELKKRISELSTDEQNARTRAGELKQQAIEFAIKVYQIDVTKAKKVVYDSSVIGEALTVPGHRGEPPTIRVGNQAFSSAPMLGSTLAHESEIHVGKQERRGRWYNDPIGKPLQEVEAYDFEIASHERFDLSSKDLADLQARRKHHYDKLTAKYKRRADAKTYHVDKEDVGS